MSEITKLYENAGIEKEVIKGCYDYYSKLGIDIWKENDCSGKNCNTCKADKSIKEYPPFTAEKQINLTQKLWELKPNVYPNFDLLTNYSYSEMIAELANHLWQDLTEEEQQQIKEILE